MLRYFTLYILHIKVSRVLYAIYIYILKCIRYFTLYILHIKVYKVFYAITDFELQMKIWRMTSLFVCPIITQELLYRFVSNFNWGTRKSTRMFLTWFWDSKLSGSTFIAKIWFPGKIVQVRVNGESNFSNLGRAGFQVNNK